MKKLNSVAFTTQGWSEYCYWQIQDRKTLKTINKLIDDTLRHPFQGLGKPEPLKYREDNGWSRRIDDKNRLVYFVSENGVLYIAQCRYH